MLMTPMLVQYVVGLCCLRRNPDAVDVTVGDLVLDTAARKRRDVDVTVTIKDEDGSVSAFKAYEVKREGQPLDVVTVEQLCGKLRDMPEVTHPAIVSSSNYTEGAINKAVAHKVALYVMKPWTTPIALQFPDFPNTGRPEDFCGSFQSTLLYWIDTHFDLRIPSVDQAKFYIDDASQIFTGNGKVHHKFPTLNRLKDDLMMRSTTILFLLEPAQTILRTFPRSRILGGGEFDVGPAWPHTHTLEIVNDKVFVMLEDKLHAIHSVTINGNLQWRTKKRIPQFYIMESAIDGKAFAGATLADFGSDDGKMFAFIFTPESRDLGVHIFQLSEKHRNIIRGLKIPLLTVSRH
jgi:hypothetical protein